MPCDTVFSFLNVDVMRNKSRIWEDMSYRKLGVMFSEKICITVSHKIQSQSNFQTQSFLIYFMQLTHAPF